MGTERKPKLKLNVKKLIREQSGGACMDPFLALAACMEKVCLVHTVANHLLQNRPAQYEDTQVESCQHELNAYEECVKIHYGALKNKPKINYTLMRLGSYFKPFKGFFKAK